MRLFLIPISSRRAFVYCRPPQLNREGAIDSITAKAAETWSKWEQAEKGWQRKLVVWGHSILQRIPYEEWALRSIPPLSARSQIEEVRGKSEPIPVAFPGNAIEGDRVLDVLRTLGTERQELHRRKMWWYIFLMPLTTPIALIPLVPNIPFFYAAYRGWSHWRAWSGSKHLIHLLDNDLLKPYSSPELVEFYAKRLRDSLGRKEKQTEIRRHPEEPGENETLYLDAADGQELGEVLDAPELAIEVERAVLQIKSKLGDRGTGSKMEL
ncbi:hypothetical protein VTN31DRAFT_1798 [Thermomyces dupontii]|uniref:uncharacterized protein n=1 Tax=Talaromyces thermophilus TaxID=28565 RepID=UPI003742EFB4